MTNFEKINSFGSFFLTNIHEPSDNSLFLEIKKSLTSEIKEDVVIGDSTFKDLKRVLVDDNSDYFTILFESYVSYHIVNESFSNFNEREGECVNGSFSFCIYNKSTYLNFILKETFADAIFPGVMKHYCLYCQNHVIHVVSITEPIIEIVD
ncbi:hypothetical protein [Pedobacter namyangjuensis]|uniref:hypothetical protein n=1 Tax=Pedobacter namyangjuensis TaxID=600626 RepID=UPI000DE2DF59|nr:hypothetical protein [Pedobacter namyangjuensis]